MKSLHWLNLASALTVAGIISSRYFSFAPALLLLLFVLAILKSNLRKFFWLFLIFVAANIYSNFVIAQQNYLLANTGQTVTLTARVRNDPAFNERKAYDFYIDKIEFNGVKPKGIIRVTAYSRDIQRFDRVRVQGKLRDGFGPYFASINFAEVTLQQRRPSLTEKIRNEAIVRLNQSSPDQTAAMSLGFLVGLRSSIDESTLENLRVSGLTHIIAVSGYNLTILVQLVRRLLAKISRRVALINSSLFLILFTLIAERTPSLERAFVISLLALIAWYFGRRTYPHTILLLAAALTLLKNPTYLFGNVSWYLSFAAFWGVLVLAPNFSKRYFRKQPKVLGSILMETTAAQIATLPVVILFFGQVSFYALIANLLVLPLIPLIMLVSFLSLFPLPLNSLFVGINHLLIRFIEEVSLIISRMPGASAELTLNSGTIFLAVAALLTISFALSRRVKQIGKFRYNNI